MKWLAASFAALIAAALTGVSVTGLFGLEGERLIFALGGAGLGLTCAFLTIAVALRLLISEGFFLAQLETDIELKSSLERYASDILPPEITSLDELITLRRQVIETLRVTRDIPTSADYREAAAFFARTESPISRLVNIAHFEAMRRNLNRSKWVLFLLAAGVLIGFGTFAVFSGKKPAGSLENGSLLRVSEIQLLPGKDWAGVAKALGETCGDPPGRIELMDVRLPAGWIAIRLLEPAACAGVKITIPATLISIPSKAPAQVPSPTANPIKGSP